MYGSLNGTETTKFVFPTSRVQTLWQTMDVNKVSSMFNYLVHLQPGVLAEQSSQTHIVPSQLKHGYMGVD